MWILELQEAGLSHRCQTGSHIARTVETATRAEWSLGLQLRVAAAAAVAAAAGSVWRGKLWRLVACCLVCAWSVGCRGTAWNLEEGEVEEVK